ncbi:hypothetical protein Sjap_024877 [Stephania japonica]|uniref:Uncharacterized protein n=1 Tax=Stephania japonica TaxID=461633 RepID=A0AAP0EGC7_9MAGN
MPRQRRRRQEILAGNGIGFAPAGTKMGNWGARARARARARAWRLGWNEFGIRYTMVQSGIIKSELLRTIKGFWTYQDEISSPSSSDGSDLHSISNSDDDERQGEYEDINDEQQYTKKLRA